MTREHASVSPPLNSLCMNLHTLTRHQLSLLMERKWGIWGSSKWLGPPGAMLCVACVAVCTAWLVSCRLLRHVKPHQVADMCVVPPSTSFTSCNALVYLKRRVRYYTHLVYLKWRVRDFVWTSMGTLFVNDHTC